MKGYMGLGLLLCFRLSHSRPTCSSSGDLEETINSLTQPLNLKDSALVHIPLFSSRLEGPHSRYEKWEQRILMNATLDVYLKIFSSLLKQDQNWTVHCSLEKLQREAVDLHHLFQKKDTNITIRLDRLAKIRVDDRFTQRKALAEFLEVYKASKSIMESTTPSSDGCCH